jgi:hypothetical protein
LLMPAADALLECYEVSTAVNRAANDSPGLIAPAIVANDGAAATSDAPANNKKPDDQLSLF